MIKKDTKLSNVLKEAFLTQEIKNKELCKEIIHNLPKRDSSPIIMEIIYTLFTLCFFIFLILNITEISNNIVTIIKLLQEQQIPNKEYIIKTISFIAIVVFIIWQIYNILEECYMFKNESIIKEVIKQKNKAVFYLENNSLSSQVK